AEHNFLINGCSCGRPCHLYDEADEDVSVPEELRRSRCVRRTQFKNDKYIPPNMFYTVRRYPGSRSNSMVKRIDERSL
ncbi:hypothetical protein LINPERHAP2_LOCUS9994, partial [Linum perenne]